MKAAKPEQSFKALASLVERITPWLFAIGSWIFGGLMAFDLVLLSSLLSIGPVDEAVLIAITVLACALPVNAAGIFLLKLTSDMKEIGIDDVALKAFQDADFPDIDAYFPAASEKESRDTRRSNIALRYALGIVTLSFVLTLTGLVAALWHMAWWVGVVLFAVVVLTAMLIVVAIAHSMPPESDAERALKRG